MEGGSWQASSAGFPPTRHTPACIQVHKRSHAIRKARACSALHSRTPAPLLWKGQKHFLPPRKPDRAGTKRPRAVESRT